MPQSTEIPKGKSEVKGFHLGIDDIITGIQQYRLGIIA